MIFKIYNTLSRKKEEFKPIDKNEVGIYSCGPTVYFYQHIGNLRTYIFSDILKKSLKLNGYNVKHIVNVTDVGHLTSDSDSGDDKMEAAAKKEGKSAESIAKEYFDLFVIDLKNLNIEAPSKWAWATKHIEEQINIIKQLEDKDYTYKTKDGIYFDSSKFSKYGDFAKLNIEGLEEGRRVATSDKKHKTDFALWKFSNPNEKRQQEWNSPWGIGFPGWHIECSAMATKYLGEHFDIHTGGIDHIPIHHTNEIAQSECAFDVDRWVNYWMHGAFLELKDGKMSKSSGKIMKLSDLNEKGFSSLDYRYFCLLTNYRKRLIFSFKNLEAAKNALSRLKNIISKTRDDGKINSEYVKLFTEAVNDDLNIPEAIQVLWKLVRSKESGIIGAIKKMDEVLSLDLLKKDCVEIPSKVKILIEERKIAKENKDWVKSDEIRDKIKELGFNIKDSKNEVIISKLI